MLLERMVCGTTAEEAEEGEKAVDHYRIIPRFLLLFRIVNPSVTLVVV